MQSKIIYFFSTALLLLSFNGSAQRTVPANYTSGIPINYIRTWDAAAPEQSATNLVLRPTKDVKVATQYLDGLGRPLQTVVKHGSLETSSHIKKDVVSPVEYDAFGRESFKYLPFVSGTADGSFKMDPFQQQATFMAAQYGAQSETYFYSQTNFEASPLNRAEKTMAAGNSWIGSNRGVAIKNWVNTADDAVRVWSVTDNPGGFGVYFLNATYNGGIYPAGTLFKNVSVDEHGKQVIEFKDKDGKVILKKVQIGTSLAVEDDGSGRGHTDWLNTYYIYDDLNNLRCVIQPEGVKAVLPTGTFVGNVLSEQCFRYEYDARGRMIMKKVPGAGEVFMVYDFKDRLVMTQDATMRNSNPVKWMVTKYDELNRPYETGLWENNTPFATHLFSAYNSNNYPTASSNYELLTLSHYDNYIGLPAGLYSSYLTNWNSHFASTNNLQSPYPQMPIQSTAVKGMLTWTKVKILGSNPAAYISSVSIYDDKSRVIQVQTINSTGGLDVATTQYSWAGQPLTTVQKQQKSGSNPQELVVINKMEYDDLGRVLNVKKTINSTINSVAVNKAEQLIVQNEYDKLGQLKVKKLGANNLETLIYDYNIRGWILGANRNYLAVAGQSGTTKFGFELGYDKQSNAANANFAAAQFNGNITGMVWKSDGDDVRRKYDFAYDAANRLLKGEFNQDNGGNSWNNYTINYSMQMGDGTDPTSAYDANGNILGMIQYGWKLGGNPTIPIDNMRYTYNDGSNKLKSVTDFTNDPQTKLGDFKTNNTHPQFITKSALTGSSLPTQFSAITDYSYDVNGNLVVDNNKDISSISYNHLNLPQHITIANNKGTISYLYDAAGNKLKKVTTENANAGNGNINTSTTTLYIGGFIYESKTDNNPTTTDYTDKLQSFGHEEGRTRALYNHASNLNQVTGFAYDYMLKDHLGNVRMVLTEEQKQDIYPAATLEDAIHNDGTAISIEDDFYTINAGNVVVQNNIPAYQNNNGNPPYNNNTHSNVTANSNKVYQLNATNNTIQNKTGLGIVLKVMAGDNISIYGKSYHKKPGGGYTNVVNNLLVADLINAFAGNSIIGGHGVTGSQISGQTGFPTSMSGLIGNQPAQNGDRLKAAINWIILDEQFKYVNGGFDMVGIDASGAGVLKVHDLSTIPSISIPKNGYIYVYCSNESQYNVFFDNLQVIHDRGALLEETHYYPFGLEQAGISPKALNNAPENKYKYNGIEKENAFEIGIYDAQLRELDGQTGRWWQVDPKTESMEMWSPYASNYNNPILYIDPLGDEPEGCCGGIWGAIKSGVKWINNNLNPLVPLAEVITGKSLDSDFTENKPRLESGVQLGTFLVPTAKVETIIVNEVKNIVVTQVEKQIVKNAETSLSRKGALSEIKKDVGISKSQHPDKLANGKQFEKVPMTNRNGKSILDNDGKPVMTREYTYTKPDGTKLKVQDHSAGHPQFGKNNPGPHFNVRPTTNTRTGTIPGTKEHYQFHL